MALVSVQFIISSLRLRLIIPSSSLINLDIKKTSSNNCSIWYYQKPETYVCFCQKFLISLNYILTYALILTCKHWDSLICTYLHFFHLYMHSHLHLHAPTFTCIHLHSLACTYLHLHALTFTCMHSGGSLRFWTGGQLSLTPGQRIGKARRALPSRGVRGHTPPENFEIL